MADPERGNFHPPLQLGALAAIANLSRSHFMELFKQQSGYAPIDNFIRLRMRRAGQLLNWPIVSVMQDYLRCIHGIFGSDECY